MPRERHHPLFGVRGWDVVRFTIVVQSENRDFATTGIITNVMTVINLWEGDRWIMNRSTRASLVICLIVLLFSGCSSPTPSPTQTPTPTATPSPTPTPIPLSEIDLEPILILPGDLPAGFDAAQTRQVIPEMFSALPKAQNQIYRQFEHDRDGAGGVTVLLYESSDDVNEAYSMIVDGFAEPQSIEGLTVLRPLVPDLGEEAEANTVEGELLDIVLDSTDLAFIRCSAVVHIRMMDTAELVEVASYARRLDARLSDLVCR